MNIFKNELKTLIEPHFEKDLIKNTYEIKNIEAKKLLTHTRFDLAFKLFFLEMENKDVRFAHEIYQEHIRAFSLGKFTEPGNENKYGIDRFIEEFHQTFEAIKDSGFDSSSSLIPLSKNVSIANGAHRVASAIYLNKSVDCVHIETNDLIYDYKFFYSRNVGKELLDVVATKFIEYADNVHVAFIWPTAQGHDKEIEEIISNIVYRKDIQLNPNGAHNLLSEIYYGEEWLGSITNNFRGAKGKLLECFKSFDPVRVIAFQADSLDVVLKIKENIRDIFNVGKHSIHITDTKDEAIRTARVVFNNNSIHFLNYAKPNRYTTTHTKIAKFKEFIEKNGFNTNDVVLDGGIVLSVYGLREANDIDYFVDDNKKIKYHDDELEYNDDELEHYDNKKSELIYNPQNYFYFNDLKFISFNQLYKMKKNRDEQRDKNDCNIMEALIENKRMKKYFTKIKQSIYYEKIKFRKQIISILQNIGLYNVTRNIYRIVKSKK